MAKNNRDVIKTLRFKDSEYRNIMRRAKEQNLQFSAYIKKMISRDYKYDPVLRREVNKLANEVNYIGHNINQIVKNHNSELYSEMDKTKLMEYMRILNEKVDKLLEQHGNK